MSVSKKSIFIIVIALTVLSIGWYAANQQHFHTSKVDFSTQIKPILNKKCISCHGGVKKQGGYSLLFEAEALAELPSGKFAIVPGRPHQSEIIRRLTLEDPEERMPYQADPLSAEEIDLLTQWVAEGANWGEHWAYQAVEKQVVPIVETDWGRTSMDQFIAKKILAKGLSPSSQADARTLTRRVALDIIGFPAPDSLAAHFLADPTDENYEVLVDELLALPHFGEKWASMWLDLARYADTKGYERDQSRAIWRYRDWLIRAFNEDMPYDQFIIEQLAGDLLPNPTDDQYLATAFHRNTMTNDEGGTDNEEFRVAAVIDRVNTTWEVLSSTTFACAQCHTHPYDPFLHKEYYEFAAFFNNTRDEDTHAEYPLLRHYTKEERAKIQQVAAWAGAFGSKEEEEKITRFIKTLSPARNSLQADQLENATIADTKWLAFRSKSAARIAEAVDMTGKNSLWVSMKGYTKGGLLNFRLDAPDGKVFYSLPINEAIDGRKWTKLQLTLQAVEGIHDIYLSYEHPISPKDEAAAKRSHLQFEWFHFTKHLSGEKEEGYQKINQLYQELIRAEVPSTPVMVENPAQLQRPTYVFERGNWLTRGEEVFPDVPASLNDFPDDAPRNRLGLAKWMTAPENPLTARTMVNRVWEQIFGNGIVETLEDLGTQSLPPTHQALLDYLSWEFMHNYQWSVKTLLKTILMSDTYRQSSVTTPEQLAIDPKNQYLARMSRIRLSAEQIRDQALFLSGAMNPELYGKPVMPYQPKGIWSSPYDNEKWRQSQGDQQYRRAIYTYWKRTSPYPSMMTFDGVGREVCSSRRIRTNTPLQALVTLNDSVYFDLSVKLAAKTWFMGTTAQERIQKAYELATYKEMTEQKLEQLSELYQLALESYQANKNLIRAVPEDPNIEEKPAFAALALVANSIINLDEVITKN
ncbi:MAG: DUF1553 domain-containing protein [Bacteroidota bacterium]